MTIYIAKLYILYWEGGGANCIGLPKKKNLFLSLMIMCCMQLNLNSTDICFNKPWYIITYHIHSTRQLAHTSWLSLSCNFQNTSPLMLKHIFHPKKKKVGYHSYSVLNGSTFMFPENFSGQHIVTVCLFIRAHISFTQKLIMIDH